MLPLIKESVDASGKKGQYWLTGSQSFHLMQNVRESLAGRAAVMYLQGLSLGESLGHGSRLHPFLRQDSATLTPDALASPPAAPLNWVFEHIWRGSFPALHVDDAPDRDLFFASYLQTFLLRDVRDLAQVGDLTAFTRFVRSAAAHRAVAQHCWHGSRYPGGTEYRQTLALHSPGIRLDLATGALSHQSLEAIGENSQPVWPPT